ncbi:MAG: tubulin-like doman-containing protein, partial [Clostridia bacterium]
MAIKKEIVGTNQTPATLFVGLGGIGSDIVKRVAERCRGSETDNIRFVILDTNTNDLREANKSKAVITGIQTSSTQSVLDYLQSDDEARKNWFPNNAILYPKTVSEGAGQVRAISRLALSSIIKQGKIDTLYREIDKLFLKDGDELKQALRVVLVSSVAGGTGSGIVMPMGMLIRDYLQKHYREKSAIIRSYLLLPGVTDTFTKSQSEKESLRRNGYATIKEINAFMMKASGFCAVKKELSRFDDLHMTFPTALGDELRLNSLPFDFCFLLDRVDSRADNMETLDDYKEFAAQSLYEQNIGPMQKDAFSMEDNIIKDFADKDNLGRNRFGGIGASVLRYPYEDVADYISYSRALDRIGGGSTAGDWSKYDRRFKLEMANYKKQRSGAEAEPKLADIYIDSVNTDGQVLGHDIRRCLGGDENSVFGEISALVEEYIAAVNNEILTAFSSQNDVAEVEANVIKLRREIDYKENEEECKAATENLSNIRTYERLVKSKAYKVASSKAKAFFHDAPSLAASDIKPYYLETLLRTNDGGLHPNAIRYILYVLKNFLEEQLAGANSEYSDVLKTLEKYSDSAQEPDLFEVDGAMAKGEEVCIDDVCNLAASAKGGVVHKIKGVGQIWDALNKHLPAYSNKTIAC